MKNSKKVAGIACIISSVAVVISAISVIISNFDRAPITIFFCMIAVFCSNLAIYFAQKKKDEGKDK